MSESLDRTPSLGAYGYPKPPVRYRGPMPAGDESLPTAKIVWNILLERRWVVVVTFLISVTLSLIYLKQAQPIYEATAVIEVQPDKETILEKQEVRSSTLQQTAVLNTERVKIFSRTVLSKVAYTLSLAKDPFFRDKVDLVEFLSRQVSVNPIRLSHLLEISVGHPEPKQAAAITNAIIDAYAANHRETELDNLTSLALYLQDEVTATEAKLKESRESIQRYQELHGTVSLAKDQDIALQALITAQTAVAQAEIDQRISQSTARAIREQLASGIELETLPQMVGDPRIVPLLNSLASAHIELERLLLTYKEEWPQVKALRTTIAELKQAITTGADEILATADLKTDQAKRRLSELQSLVADREAAHLDLNQKRIQFDIRTRNAAQLEALYNTLLSRLEEVRIAQRSFAGQIKVVDRAIVPLEPAKPNLAIVLAIGIMGGILAGVLFALLLNTLDESIGSQDDVESVLGLKFLGYIARIRGRNISDCGLDSLLNPHSPASESFRTLRATIALLPNGTSYQTIAVSCANSGEGKSLTMSNLAIVCAQAGTKTLLVDADLRRPTIHKLYDLPNRVGLTQFLRGTAGFDETVQATKVPNLDIVPSGKIPRNPAELIASDVFKAFVAEARQRYDRIIIDSPPASAVGDPLSIAAQCDGVVFISRFRRIRREHARRVVQQLREAGVPIIGGLINDISAEKSYKYYYYYQNYYKSTETVNAELDPAPPKRLTLDPLQPTDINEDES